MHAVELPPSWNIDAILDDLDRDGFSLIDEAYPHDYIEQLKLECMQHLNEFRNAAIQNGVVSDIRSDHILWLHAGLEISHQHTQTLALLAQQFNQAFYLGIKDIEAHFACYNAGEFYTLHRDNPQGKNGRLISSVYYLHEKWQNDWGGELRLQDKNGHWHIIPPQPNRLTLFQSDLLHEVLQAKQQRLSITAWLRNDLNII